ncbi:hypothetical protein DY000_02043639 [Brassica cretica]|uniref:Raptor N-terminal CASPase-like domain-containing protein n=1 Tax=Brassica cretica TaxID=69181 RepID=A0ABQ7BCA5_BRACR|nr:hypothetical protein DY000_02043639 [Brassica cretica]
MKRVSITSPSRLPIFLLPGSIEIHLVSRGNIDGGYRAVLFRLMGALARFPPIFKPLSLGYFNVFLDYLKLSRAVVSRIQVKIICGSLYFELVSPFNTSILSFIVFMLLLFILPSSIPPVTRLVIKGEEVVEDPAEKEGDVRRAVVIAEKKTGCVALVLCLNITADPPDVIKISPCARIEAWIG